MSPVSHSSMRRFRVGAAVLLVCMSLPLADRLSVAVGAEMAAFLVFMFLFTAWLAVGLVLDAMWGSRATEAAELGHATEGERLSQT
jgi:uncharacterized membrane protein YdfJ with MMPL/SSD domain